MKITLKLSPVVPGDDVTSRQVYVAVTDAAGNVTDIPPIDAFAAPAEFEVPDGGSFAARLYDLSGMRASIPSAPPFSAVPQLPGKAPTQPKILGYTVSA